MQIDFRNLPIGTGVGMGVLVECPRCKRPGVRKRAPKSDKYVHTLVITDTERTRLPAENPVDERQVELFPRGPRTTRLFSVRQDIVTECVIPVGFDWKDTTATMSECRVEGAVLYVRADRLGEHSKWVVEWDGGELESGETGSLTEARKQAQEAYLQGRG